MSGERADILPHPDVRCGRVTGARHQSVGSILAWTVTHGRWKKGGGHLCAYAAAVMTSFKFEIVLMSASASKARVSLSLSLEPSANNYNRPVSRTRSHQAASLDGRGIINRAIAKRSTPRSGPVSNLTFDSSPPFFLLYHLSTSLSRPSHAVTVEFPSKANLYFQDNQCLDTHSFPILLNGRPNGNWRFNFSSETQESFWIWLPPSPFQLGCPSCHPPPLPPTPTTAAIATRYLRPGLLSTANFSACMETWVRWLPLKKPCSSSRLLPDTFPPRLLPLINKPPSNKQTLITKRGLFSALLPAGCWVAI